MARADAADAMPTLRSAMTRSVSLLIRRDMLHPCSSRGQLPVGPPLPSRCSDAPRAALEDVDAEPVVGVEGEEQRHQRAHERMDLARAAGGGHDDDVADDPEADA